MQKLQKYIDALSDHLNHKIHEAYKFNCPCLLQIVSKLLY